MKEYKYIERIESYLQILKDFDFKGKSIEKIAKELGLSSTELLSILGSLIKANIIKDVKIV